jgi:hypothetical protein
MAATYPRNVWVDEAVEYPDRYTEQQLSGGMVNLVPAPGDVDTVGTPQSAVNFNALEKGLFDAHIAHGMLAIHVGQMSDALDLQIAESTPEIGTAVVSNTKTFPFFYSTQTVALQKTRKTLNYNVEILSAVSTDGKPVGEVLIANKQLNGFYFQYTGSAESVTIQYKVMGGFKA